MSEIRSNAILRKNNSFETGVPMNLEFDRCDLILKAASFVALAISQNEFVNEIGNNGN